MKWSKLRHVSMNPDWRAGYFAGRTGRPPVVPQGIKEADAWREGYAIGLRPSGRRRHCRGSRVDATHAMGQADQLNDFDSGVRNTSN